VIVEGVQVTLSPGNEADGRKVQSVWHQTYRDECPTMVIVVKVYK